jgi:hypothetical protein
MKEILQVLIPDGSATQVMQDIHAVFGIVREMIDQVARVGLYALSSGKSAQSDRQKIHVEEGNLRPGRKRRDKAELCRQAHALVTRAASNIF